MAIHFFGGVHPDDRKRYSSSCPIEAFPAPETVVIPLSQHIGAPCKPLVQRGDTVTVGQKIGDNQGLCVPVHASVSGTVKAVEVRPHTNGTMVPSIVIVNDGKNTLCPDIQPRKSIEDLDAAALMDIIREAGIVGMGGATFPTHVKLSSGLGKVDTIIVNASECEPFITADDRLLREQPRRVLGGIRVLQKILGLDKAWIGMEDNKPEAAEAVRAAIEPGSGIELEILKARYPQGAEKQLIQAITGRQIPPGGLPAAVGCAVFNTATCAAIYDAVFQGMPLISRVVTVTGDIVGQPRNLLVPIGTSFQSLIDTAELTEDPYKILSGGPMMGVTQYDLQVPVIKGSNAIVILGKKNRFANPDPRCIRCGKCVEVCPMHLMPLQIYRAERHSDLEALDQYHLLDCIECGCCAYTCPAAIPLVQSFRAGKQKVRNAQMAAKAAAAGGVK